MSGRPRGPLARYVMELVGAGCGRAYLLPSAGMKAFQKSGTLAIP